MIRGRKGVLGRAAGFFAGRKELEQEEDIDGRPEGGSGSY